MVAAIAAANLRDALRLLAARSLRAFGDGFVALLAPIYLYRIGFGPFAIGVIVTAGSLISGWLLTASSFGWPLVVGGTVKAAYDLILLAKFQKIRPPEEAPAA